MAFFPDVSRGQKFTPSVLLSNNLRHLVNSVNGFQGFGSRGVPSGTVRIQVYNNSDEEIMSGTAVSFSDSGSFCENAIPCEKFKDENKPWGVLMQTLESKQFGDCIISGPAVVSVTGSGDYAVPRTSSPGIFERGGAGAAILFSSDDGKAVINIGASMMQPSMFTVSIHYEGESVRVSVTGGMLFFNRIFVPDCPEKTSIPAKEGFLCIKAEQENETTVFVDYEIVENPGDFPVMGDNSNSAIVFYPVAKISGSDSDGWTVKQILRYQIPHLWAFGPCD